MRRVALRQIGCHGVLVRLPRIFWLYREFRARFPKASPTRHAWSWAVPGDYALARCGVWAAEVELRVARELMRRRQIKHDDEWESAAPISIGFAQESMAQRVRNKRRAGVGA